MKLGLALALASLFSHHVWAASALVTNVRTGEVDGKTRFVIVTDQQRQWVTRIEDDYLVLRAPHTQNQLSNQMKSIRSSQIGKIQFEQQADTLEVKIQLLKPLKIVKARQFPVNDAQQARWVVDLQPDADVSKEKKHLETQLSAQDKPAEGVPIATPIVTESPIPPKPPHRQAKLNPIVPKKTQMGMIDDDKPLEVVVQLASKQPSAPVIEPFKGTRQMIIALDAGHGGRDVGAISVSGKLEKHLTLSIAKELKRQIDLLPGMTAVLVRDRDVFIPLHERPRIARMMGADVFVSLHADSYHDHHIAGASFYVVSPNGASSRLAQFVATHSNQDHVPQEMDAWSESLASSIGQIALESSMNDSRKLAVSMIGSLRRSGIPLQYGRVQSANFMVLKNIDMPSVLVEMGFISNPEQNKLLHDPQYQKKLAASLTKGLLKFAQVQPEPGIVYATLNAVRGDSMTSIAARHGISVDYLARANGLGMDEKLKVGQKLKVPVNLTRRSALISDSRG